MDSNFLADFFLKILGLVETLLGIFGADTTTVRGMIEDFEEAYAKQDATENN